MQDFTEKNLSINDRFFLFADYQGISRYKISADTGISESLLYNYHKGKSKIGTDALEAILNKYEVSPEWLLTGKGSMLRDGSPPQAPAVAQAAANTREGIPLIPVEAMAGVARGEVNVLELDCERFVVPVFKGADYLITVKGSSMIPKYNSGDIVACKTLALQDVFFQWNKVYVLDTDQGVLIKRIHKTKDDEHISLVSDNKDYEPFQLHLSKIHAIAIVMGVIRLE